MDAVKQWLKISFRAAARPLGSVLARVGVSANGITILGVLLAFPSAYGFYAGSRSWAFFGLLGSALADLLDGAVARAGGRSGTRFGAALDSTLDRYGEGVVLGGIVLGLASREAPFWLLSVATLAGIGSYLVSYVRARSEGLGIACEVGFMERPERIVCLLTLALWGDGGAPWVLSVLAVLTHLTFAQRLLHIQRSDRPSKRS